MWMRSSSRRSILLLFALVVLFTAIGVRFAQREETDREESLAPTPVDAAPDASSSLAVVEAQHSRREASSAVPASEVDEIVSELPPLHEPFPRVSGRVLDLLGAPVADARITVECAAPEAAPELARSGKDGRFEFAAREHDLVLTASGPGLGALRTQAWRSQAPRDGFIVVAPSIDVAGDVVDEAGTGLAQVTVLVEFPEAILAGFPLPLESSESALTWSTTTNVSGRFELRRAICVEGARITASRSEFLPASVPMPRDPSTPEHFVLKRDPNSKERLVTGVVIRANGMPAAGASVQFGDQRGVCDDRGGFVVRVPEWLQDPCPLVATEPGSQAAIVPDFGRVVRLAPSMPPSQRLLLGPPALSIRGRVFDDGGQPLPNCSVALLDPVVANIRTSPPTTAEDLVAGTHGPVTTSADGEFELGGLFEREYRLQIVDAERLGRLETDPIRAGAEGVAVRFPADTMVPEISGRVFDHAGTPLADITVDIMVVTSRVGTRSSSHGRTQVKTRKDGYFRILDVPRHAAELSIRHTDLVPKRIAVEDLSPWHDVRITADRYCSVRFEGLPGASEKHWIAAHDADGRELPVYVVSGRNRSGTNRVQTDINPAQVYSVSEAAVEFVHYFPYDTVIARRALHLVPDEVTVVKW